MKIVAPPHERQVRPRLQQVVIRLHDGGFVYLRLPKEGINKIDFEPVLKAIEAILLTYINDRTDNPSDTKGQLRNGNRFEPYARRV
jgi:hypothetical protein